MNPSIALSRSCTGQCRSTLNMLRLPVVFMFIIFQFHEECVQPLTGRPLSGGPSGDIHQHCVWS